MINVSKAFRRNLYEGNNKFLIRLVITLQDDTELEVKNDNIMSNNGILIDDAVSEDDDFTALGSTIINACDVILYNNTNLYSDYEFINAKVVVYIGLQIEENVEEFKKGTYTVDDAIYGDSTISLSLVDEMAQFDRPYNESQLRYPATLNDIILNACSICNVPLATNSLQFPHRDFLVAEKPNEESTTFREIIGWTATIAGCFARCNVDGELELAWFNINALDNEQETSYDGGTFNPWSEGNTVDGGTFNPWSTGNTVDGGNFTDVHNVHYISSLYSQSLGVDDVVITGVRITVEIEDTESDEDIKEFIQGTDNYLIDISDNKFITADSAPTVLNWLATLLIGTRFRKCDIQHLTDPTIEAGDVALLWDTKGIEHRILVTRVDFSPTSLQTVISGAASVGRNSATRFSNQTKSYVATRRQLREQKDTYDDALERLEEKVNNASGLYETDVTQSGGSVIKYYHNKPELSESDIQLVISDVGITVTSNGTAEHPTWYGLTVDGNLITSILNTVGINADWIRTGSISDATGSSYWNLEDGIFNLVGEFTLLKSYFLAKMSYSQIDSYDIDSNNVVQRISGTNRLGYTMQFRESDTPYTQMAFQPTKNSMLVGYTYNSDVAPSSVFFRESIFTKYTSTASGTNEYGFERYVASLYSIGLVNFTTKERQFTIVAAQNHVYGIFGKQRYVSDASVAFELGTSQLTIKCAGTALRGTSGSTYLSWNSKNLAYVSSSSKRYKKEIEELKDENLDPHKLYDLQPKQFKYNKDAPLQYPDMEDKLIPGFIAEEVAKIYPAAVIYDDDKRIESWDERRIIPGMLSLIQEQKQKIDELEERIARLEKLLLKGD